MFGLLSVLIKKCIVLSLADQSEKRIHEKNESEKEKIVELWIPEPVVLCNAK